MGFFDDKETNKRIDKLERNFENIKQNFKNFKEDINESNKKAPEFEKEAKEASRKTSEFRNKAFDTLENAKNLARELENLLNSIKHQSSKSSEDYNNLQKNLEEIDLNKKAIEAYIARLIEIDEHIANIESIYENHPSLDSEISELENRLLNIKDYENKSLIALRQINSKKKELESLYDEILGYQDKNIETGEENFIPGLKQELENAFDGLDEKVKIFKEKQDSLEQNTANNVNNFLNKNSEKVKDKIDDWEEKFQALNSKIESLLPKAVTAGLSHAFSDKKNEEVNNYQSHRTLFFIGILGMIIVSIIPFLLSIYFFSNGDELNTIINRAPKLAIAILPLYIPVLWLSISSSKKLNLTKRLIEEYSHKEVISKTYEGLSKQIEDLGEDKLSEKLKINLLQDFLLMYSENPGKLISDYNNTDHPIVELLSNSERLEKTLAKIEKIPGLNKVTNHFEKRLERNKEHINSAVNKSIDFIDDIKES